MTYTNSSLATYKRLSPCNSGQRTHEIDRITPHCVVGQCTIEALGELFQNYERQTSSNYGIDKNGRVGLFVEEKNRSWCSSSNANDQRAITIECASDTKDPYTMNEAVYDKLVLLCEDICRRYNKKKLLWIDDRDKALAYTPKEDEILLTVHRWFANKSCPGRWLYDRLGGLAKEVTAKLNPQEKAHLYRVQIGAFSAKWRADLYAAKAKLKKFPAFIYAETVNGKVIYRVQCGAFSKKENAENYAKDLKKAGFDSIIVEVK